MTQRSTQADAEWYYSEHAGELLERYEGVGFETVHADLIPYLPQSPGDALDIGAGSGRDAAWLAAHGWSVVAVEPCAALRDGGRHLHANASVQWLDDELPDLSRTLRLDRKFDLILLSAVWMHVPSLQEETALSALAELAVPGAILSISVRMGGDDKRRGFYPVDTERLRTTAGRRGFTLVAERMSRDRFGRPEVAWTSTVFRRR